MDADHAIVVIKRVAVLTIRESVARLSRKAPVFSHPCVLAEAIFCARCRAAVAGGAEGCPLTGGAC